MLNCTAEDLFEQYQSDLRWIDRRRTPEALKFYRDQPNDWRYAKLVAFKWYENMRTYVENGVPAMHGDRSCIHWYTEQERSAVPPYKINDEWNDPAVGEITYRGRKFIVYNDDNGMMDYIVIGNYPIDISCDWWYEVDRLLDKIEE